MTSCTDLGKRLERYWIAGVRSCERGSRPRGIKGVVSLSATNSHHESVHRPIARRVVQDARITITSPPPGSETLAASTHRSREHRAGLRLHPRHRHAGYRAG